MAAPIHHHAHELKAATKEGGKKGVDMVGMSDLGGVKFFTIAVESANGNLELLKAVLEGANAPVDEAAEERKGGAGQLGKLLMSAGEHRLLILGHVPAALAQEKDFKLSEWIKAVLEPVGGGKILEESETMIVAEAEGDSAKELFPLKMRDASQQAAFAFLKSKGLIPDDDSDDYVLDPEAAGIDDW